MDERDLTAQDIKRIIEIADEMLSGTMESNRRAYPTEDVYYEKVLENFNREYYDLRRAKITKE